MNYGIVITTLSEILPGSSQHKPGASNAPSKFFMKSGALPLPWM